MASKINITKPSEINKKKIDNKNQNQNYIRKKYDLNKVIYYNCNKQGYFTI